jgi:protein-S-isoprenylcysteine O-methyltransferase Ste14
MKNESNRNEKIGIKLVLKSISIFIVFIIITFITAGRLDYWQGWLFNGLNILFILITYIILIDRKDLIKERLKPGKGMKQWDRIYYAVSTPIFFIMLIISILDATRFYWGPSVPISIILLGIILYSIGQVIGIWAKKANKFFSSVVRIQTERNQTVCTNGPYRFVRHPGYAGGLIFTIGTPLMLGSFWGLFPAIITIVLLSGRTYMEDKTLKTELPGYNDYAQKVRYRLIPYIW